MFIKNFLLTAAAILVLSSHSVAQESQLPKRTIGEFQVDEHTTAPLQLVKRVQLDSSSTRVFAVLENYEKMPMWMPMLKEVRCDRSASDGTNGIGTARVCVLQDGHEVEEQVVGFEEGGLIAYVVTKNPMGLRDHLAVVTTESAPSGGTTLTWRQYFNHPQSVVMTDQLDGMINVALQKLVAGFGGGDMGTSRGFEQISIRERFTVNAPTETVWHVVGRDFGGVSKWARLVPHAKLEKLADGSICRTCQTPAGEFSEVVTAYKETEREISYRVDEGMPPVVKLASTTWTVSPSDENQSLVQMDMSIQIQPGVSTQVVEMLRANFGEMARVSAEDLAYFAENGKPSPAKAAMSK